ncbi:MAG: hypothetical protein O7G87_00055 [bacterium]|nr:hypothetical protein [bacterium]
MAVIRQAEQAEQASANPRRITSRAVFWGMATGVFLNVYSDYTGMILGSASLVKSQLPMAMLLPFVAWLAINLVLKICLPRLAFSSAELLMIYSMSWVVGTVSASGWTTYWGGILSSPVYYASPENRWEELLFDVMPWWCLPQTSTEVIRTFYEGLPDGASIPWGGWAASLYWWFTISMALVVAGLCISVLFQKQWEEAERLTFPLAVFPVALTEGFDEAPRIPSIFRDKVFLAGFGLVFGVFAWNMAGYFMRELPRISIFDGYLTKEVTIARMFPSIYLRVLPPVIGLTYLCNLDVLLSFWVFRLIAIFKEGLMARVGFAVGYTGQQAEASEILNLESHGALVFLALWSVWTARYHLKRVWAVAVEGVRKEGDDGVIPYRYALVCLAAATLYVLGCLVALGLSFHLAIFHVVLMYVAYFTVTKYTAASGFSYLFPVGGKGGSILQSLMGTAELTRANFVGLGLINSSVFFGNSRIPAWPSLPHHLRLFGGVEQGRRWVPWAVILAFATGFLGSCLFIIYLGYEHAGQNLGLSGFSVTNRATYDRMVAAIVGSDKTIFDPAKLTVWVLGGLIAALLMQMCNRIPWWPLHPLGLAFQTQSGSRVYAFSMFLTWAAKHIILRIGGIGLYERARPFFFGLVIGYVVGLGCSSILDMTWFPDDGHWVHGW